LTQKVIEVSPNVPWFSNSQLLLLLMLPIATTAGLAWSCTAVVRWAGVWRILASLPIAAALVCCLFVFERDWWLLLAICFSPSLPYIAVVSIIRRRLIRKKDR